MTYRLWTSLPRDLRRLIMDFYGDTSVSRHRRFRFVRAELKTMFLFQPILGNSLRPSFVHRIARINCLKKILELTYLNSKREALRKHHGSTA